jgi:hypothetical protein
MKIDDNFKKTYFITNTTEGFKSFLESKGFKCKLNQESMIEVELDNAEMIYKLSVEYHLKK